MSTPRTRKPVRFTVKPKSGPAGTYRAGVWDEEITTALGMILTLWPHIEGEMIPLFKNLAGIGSIENARVIFRTIIAQAARIDVMRSLLEKSPHNIYKTEEFDRLIDEFRSLNRVRNAYAHSLWYTHEESAQIYIEEETNTSGLIFLNARLVTKKEVEGVLNRMMKLVRDLQSPSLYRPPA